MVRSLGVVVRWLSVVAGKRTKQNASRSMSTIRTCALRLPARGISAFSRCAGRAHSKDTKHAGGFDD